MSDTLAAFDAAAGQDGAQTNTLSAFDSAVEGAKNAQTKASPYQGIVSKSQSAQSLGESMLRGAAGSIYGGLKGLGTLATGGDINQAAESVRSGQQAFESSAPLTSAGQVGQKIIASPYNPINYPAEVGHYIGGKLADIGHPGLATVADVGAQFLGPSLVAGAARGAGFRVPGVVAEQPIQPSRPITAIGQAPEQAVPITQQPNPWSAAIQKPQVEAPAIAVPSANSGHSPTLADTPPEFQAAASKIQNPDPNVMGRYIEAQSLPVPVHMSPGQASGHPGILSDEINHRDINGMSQIMSEQNQGLIDNIAAVKTKVAPDVPQDANHVAYGQGLIDQYKTYDEGVKADIAQKYQALRDAAGGNLMIDGQQFANNAYAALKKNLKSNYIPDELKPDLDRYSKGEPMTFEDFEALRTNLAHDMRKFQRSGDGTREAAVNIIRNSLEELPLTNETAQIKPIADAARAAARDRFQQLESDPAYKAAVNDGTQLGELSPKADKFIQQYVIGAPSANVAKMRQTLAGNNMADQYIAGGALNHLERQGVKSGKFTQAGYNGVLARDIPVQKQAAIFDPQTMQQVNAIGNVGRYVQAQPSGSYIGSSNTAIAARRAGTGLIDIATGGLAGKAASIAEPVMRDIRAAKLRNPVGGFNVLENMGQEK